MSVENDYFASIIQQRSAREEKMLSTPLNWLSLAGLFPLQDGVNSIGNSPQFSINLSTLPAGVIGSLLVREDGVYLSAADPSFRVNGQAPAHTPLRQDVEGEPDLIEAGPLAMLLIRRNNRPYLRVWDREAPALRDFEGLRYFPIDPKYRILAVYQPFETPRSIRVMDAIGGEHETFFPGQARFTLHETVCSLIAEENNDGLLFNFTDLTHTDTTYPGGRYLLTEYPREGTVILDFNLARNWPCAYTPFATCPLPPAENHLKVRIAAGEMRYHD